MTPGYLDLHPNPAFNFFMNRLRWTNAPDELRRVGARITTMEDWVREMLEAAKAAEAEGRLLEAANYWRAAEFYMGTDHPAKAEAYDRFLELHDKALPDLASRRTNVAFRGGQMPVIDLVPEGEPRGTILAHSGFDGLVEEMVTALGPLVDAGYRVIAFEGPGQGAALRHHGLHMEPGWEKPVAEILDHFDVRECTLVGMSLGGYLAPRAAAFEPRIHRVVAWGAMFDFAGCFAQGMGKAKFAALSALLRVGARGRVNAAIARVAASDPIASWAVGHGMHVSGAADPFAFFQWLKRMNLRAVSDRIRQDVLIVMGTEDHLVPFEQVHEQAQALTRARSVSVRIATAEEQGAQHCQIGNPGLVVDEIVRWLDGLRRRDESLEAA
ncbi:MAG: alpha/beta hydrolase [Myxococcota bacterium]|nr:alpha/beta hydrolase [Myxococcota bacterium]